jgi:hypothetical protein
MKPGRSNSPFNQTQTRKGGRASKVLLRLGVFRKRSLGPVNGGVRGQSSQRKGR